MVVQEILRRTLVKGEDDLPRARAEPLRRMNDSGPPKPSDMLVRAALLFPAMLVIGLAVDAYFGAGAP